MEETKIRLSEKINQKAILFLYSKLIILIIFLVISVVFLLSFYQFFFSEGIIKGKNFVEWKENGSEWIIYFWFGLSFISAFVGILGDIFLHRNNKRCFIFYFIFIFSYFLSCLILFLWFEAIEQIIVFFLVLFAYLNWGKKNNEKEKISSANKYLIIFLLFFLILFTFIFGALIKYLLDDTNFADQGAYLDAFVTLSFLIGWFLLIKKYIEAYFFYFLSTVAAIILSIDYHTWIYLFSNFFYIFLYFLGINNWFSIQKKNQLS